MCNERKKWEKLGYQSIIPARKAKQLRCKNQWFLNAYCLNCASPLVQDHRWAHTCTQNTSKSPHVHLTAPRHSRTLKVFNPSDAAVHLCSLQRMILIPKGDRNGEAFSLRLSESHLSPTHSAQAEQRAYWEETDGGGKVEEECKSNVTGLLDSEEETIST